MLSFSFLPKNNFLMKTHWWSLL